MIDERDLLKRIIASAEVEASEAVGPRQFDKREDCRLIISIFGRALATQPEPDAVPELPEWLEHNDISRSWHVTMSSGLQLWLSERFQPNDLDRIAEACTKLAARERARRAGS